MKMFSMIFIILFFLSFTSIASTEPEYTITNTLNDNANVILYISAQYTGTIPQEITDTYSLEINECVQLTASQFKNLSIDVHSFSFSIIDYYKRLCSQKDNTCQPNNYEIINDPFIVFDSYQIQPTNQANTDCLDIEQWLELKELEYNISMK